MDHPIRPKEGGFLFTTVPLPLATSSHSPEEQDDDLEHEYEIKEQDRWLPLANVGRVMRKALPSQGKLSKEATMCMQECVSEFISFITSGAVDKCQAEKRKTLNGEDVLYAMYTLGFENYAETLKIYLAKYRESESLDAEARREKDKRKRRQRKEKKEREKLQQEAAQTDQRVESTQGNDGLNADSLQDALMIPEQRLSDFGLESQDMAQFVMEPAPQTDFEDELPF